MIYIYKKEKSSTDFFKTAEPAKNVTCLVVNSSVQVSSLYNLFLIEFIKHNVFRTFQKLMHEANFETSSI